MKLQAVTAVLVSWWWQRIHMVVTAGLCLVGVVAARCGHDTVGGG